jgi:hypothetical protein
VTVVFGTAQSDHNGALKTNSNLYATASGRTLFFEVNKRRDFNRYRALLKRTNVRASTMVFAAHGDPVKGMNFGKVQVRPHSRDRKNDISVDDMGAVVSAMEDITQDSRGKDDPEEAIGKRRVILHSCSQEVQKAEVTRTLPNGQKVVRIESTAESIMRTLNKRDLETYAVDAVMALLQEGTGARAVRFPDYDKRPDYHEPWEVTRLVFDSANELVALRQATLELRPHTPQPRVTMIAMRPPVNGPPRPSPPKNPAVKKYIWS